MITLIALAGCARQRDELREALLNAPPPRQRLDADYRVACPDVLRILVEGRPEFDGRHSLQANGCIDLGVHGGLRVEGLTVAQISREIAGLARVPPPRVRVDIDQYRSKQVYLFGEVTGLQRAVHYEGEESVVDLLRRTGGITPDAAPDEVRVVRNPYLSQSEPEVINVDLRAVLLKGDERANVKIKPYDQIYVPETKQARVGRCLHPLLRPLCYLWPCKDDSALK